MAPQNTQTVGAVGVHSDLANRKIIAKNFLKLKSPHDYGCEKADQRNFVITN